ncbi:MAG: CHRD domain-containing protein [Candidatus Methylomirabilales bacterium]
MRTIARVAFATAALAVFALNPVGARANDDLRAKLVGFQEVPAVSSTGNGTFRATIADDRQSFSWTLEYEDLEGAVQQAHIHFGQKSVNGGIVVFLCTNLGNGPAGTAACPQSGTVEGTATAASMVNTAAAQGLAAGEFAELLRAIRRDVAYANVHTDKHPGGEIRGQIKTDRDDD